MHDVVPSMGILTRQFWLCNIRDCDPNIWEIKWWCKTTRTVGLMGRRTSTLGCLEAWRQAMAELILFPHRKDLAVKLSDIRSHQTRATERSSPGTHDMCILKHQLTKGHISPCHLQIGRSWHSWRQSFLGSLWHDLYLLLNNLVPMLQQ